MSNNEQPFDFSLIAHDCESSDGQSRYIYGADNEVKKTESVESENK